MITKYRAATGWHSVIDVVQVERETESSVWIKGRRSAKMSSFDCYFDTWDAAHEYLIKNATEAFIAAERRFQDAKDECRRINEMERPERQEIEA